MGRMLRKISRRSKEIDIFVLLFFLFSLRYLKMVLSKDIQKDLKLSLCEMQARNI